LFSDDCRSPNWPGPWTACPEADWVREIAERAGFRVTGETGSALIAQGKGRSFYIWATEVASRDEFEKVATREEWRSLGAVAGVDVYGDQHLWRWWVANDFVFWLQAGPKGDSQIPAMKEMGSLVRASETLLPPR
jgi:hypothetical protein